MDVAVAEPSLSFAGRLRERENKLFSKIEETLELIDQGLCGDGTGCGEEI